MPSAQHDLHTRTTTMANGRIVITRRVHAPAAAVWSVLADGWLYATWVVGASRIREVEPTWPQPSSRLHHSFGVWPALIDDHTEVITSDPGRELLLKARGWPAGEAHVRIKISSTGEHSSVVSIAEDASAGPGTLIPRSLRQVVLNPRNTETLNRLALVAEGQHRHGRTGQSSAPSPMPAASAHRRSS